MKPSTSDNVKLLQGMPARTNSNGMRQSKLAPGFAGKTTDAEQFALFQQRMNTIIEAANNKMPAPHSITMHSTGGFPAKGLGLLRHKYDSESI